MNFPIQKMWVILLIGAEIQASSKFLAKWKRLSDATHVVDVYVATAYRAWLGTEPHYFR